MVSISDKFGRPSAVGQYASPTTVTADRSIGDLSVLSCFDLSGASENTPVYFITYKKTVDPETQKVSVSNKISWKGLANVTNNTITNLQVSPGYTDLGNAIGDFIEFMPTSEWGGDLVDGLLTSLDPSGGIKASGAPNGITFSASETQPTPDPDGRVIAWFKPL